MSVATSFLTIMGIAWFAQPASLSPTGMPGLRMSDWRPQVARIMEVKNHPNADALDVVKVLGDFPVVVRRNEYKLNDLAAYIPIDTVVPDTEHFYFLCPRVFGQFEEGGKIKSREVGPRYPLGSVPEKHRIIKARHIRGVYSQGMLMECPLGLCESDSVVDALQLKKWEEEEEENLPGVNKGASTAEDPPSGWTIPEYDVIGIRQFVECLKEGEEVVLTEKLHGSNAAFVHDGVRLWVKSRNQYKKRSRNDMWWAAAIRYDLENRLQLTPNMVFFGEIYGKVRGFRYDCNTEEGSIVPRLRIFDVWDVVAGRYLDADDRARLIAAAGLEPVPELYHGPWLGRDRMYALAEGPTTLGGGKHVREGWVLVTARERFEPALGSRMQVKLVGEGYNLRK